MLSRNGSPSPTARTAVLQGTCGEPCGKARRPSKETQSGGQSVDTGDPSASRVTPYRHPLITRLPHQLVRAACWTLTCFRLGYWLGLLASAGSRVLGVLSHVTSSSVGEECLVTGLILWSREDRCLPPESRASSALQDFSLGPPAPACGASQPGSRPLGKCHNLPVSPTNCLGGS